MGRYNKNVVCVSMYLREEKHAGPRKEVRNRVGRLIGRFALIDEAELDQLGDKNADPGTGEKKKCMYTERSEK